MSGPTPSLSLWSGKRVCGLPLPIDLHLQLPCRQVTGRGRGSGHWTGSKARSLVGFEGQVTGRGRGQVTGQSRGSGHWTGSRAGHWPVSRPGHWPCPFTGHWPGSRAGHWAGPMTGHWPGSRPGQWPGSKAGITVRGRGHKAGAGAGSALGSTCWRSTWYRRRPDSLRAGCAGLR